MHAQSYNVIMYIVSFQSCRTVYSQHEVSKCTYSKLYIMIYAKKNDVAYFQLFYRVPLLIPKCNVQYKTVVYFA